MSDSNLSIEPTGSDTGGNTDGNSQPTNWLQGVDSEVADFITKSTIKDLPSLAKSFMETKRAFSSRPTFEVPKAEDADKWKQIKAAMGVPEAPDKYEWGDAAEGMDKNALTEWGGLFHEEGVPAKTAQRLLSTVKEKAEAAKLAEAEKFQQDSEAAYEKLKLEWGDKFEANKDLAARGLQKFAGMVGGISKEQLAQVEKAIGTRATHMLALQLGRGLVEASFTGPDGQTRSMSKDAAHKRRGEIARNPDWLNSNSPTRPALQAEWAALGEIINQ